VGRGKFTACRRLINNSKLDGVQCTLNNFQDKVSLVWNIAELLRGPYKKEQYGDVVLPMAVLRRFDCVLALTKEQVLARYEALKRSSLQNIDPILNKVSGQEFSKTSKYDFEKLLADPDDVAMNLRNYINGFSKNAREIIEYFEFDKQITKMAEHDVLYLIIAEFNKVDFHPDAVSNEEMGYIFEELIRKFSENGEAGDHYTPREVIRLMVNLLLCEDGEDLTQKGLVTTFYDCCAGTGGMLSVSEQYLRELNPEIQVESFGQELNPQSYAICKADMLIKGEDASHIVIGDSFTQDGNKGQSFRYMLTNPPFGVEWKKAEKFIRDEYESEGFDGRFGAGLPRISDGSLMFLQHLISKMKQDDKGSRIAIVFNGSPLFTGDAGSGESEIRRWIIENDMLEAIVALPDQLFYNTGISTYVLIVANRKNGDLAKGAVRTGKVQLINVVEFYQKMRKSLGNKRHEISDEQIKDITRLFGNFEENEYCKIFDNEDFGYRKIVVERPLRLNFQTSEERINRLHSETGFTSLGKFKKKGQAGLEEIEQGKKIQQKIIEILQSMDSSTVYKNRDAFVREIKKTFKKYDFVLSSSYLKFILSALSEKYSGPQCQDTFF
jgi:type I restriction enzyme M protein